LIIYLNDVGVFLQILGIFIALSVTRYLFHIAIIIHVIYKNRKKIFTKIDFGHPKNLSEYFLMQRVYSKILVNTFMKYFKNSLNGISTDEILKSGISNIMIGIGVTFVIVGLILTTTYFKEISFSI